MADFIELDETVPLVMKRQIRRSQISRLQEIEEPPQVIITLTDGSSFVATKASFDRTWRTKEQ